MFLSSVMCRVRFFGRFMFDEVTVNSVSSQGVAFYDTNENDDFHLEKPTLAELYE